MSAKTGKRVLRESVCVWGGDWDCIVMCVVVVVVMGCVLGGGELLHT